MAVIRVEGPLAQAGNRGYPLARRWGSGRVPLLGLMFTNVCFECLMYCYYILTVFYFPLPRGLRLFKERGWVSTDFLKAGYAG